MTPVGMGFIAGHSPMHRWGTLPKLLGLVALMFSFAAVQQVALLVPIALVTLGFYCLSRLPPRHWWQQLRYPGLMVMGLVGVLPWMSGSTVLWQWGSLALRQEGLLAMLLISGRCLTIITLGMILLGTTPMAALLRCLRSIGCPPMLVDMLLLTYRYLYHLRWVLHTMQIALHLRGFSWHPQTTGGKGQLGRRWRTLVWLVGSLLVRSYDQSQRVYQAMRLRGYGANPSGPMGQWAYPPGHWLACLGCWGIALTLVVANLWA